MRIHKYKMYVAVVLLPALLSIGCEGETGSSGIVYDAQTSMPLDSVLYKRLGKNISEKYTDSTGTYEMYGDFGPCVPDCPDLNIEFSKPGYKSIKLRNPDRKDIYLEKED